jgi:hypothetical protein
MQCPQCQADLSPHVLICPQCAASHHAQEAGVPVPEAALGPVERAKKALRASPVCALRDLVVSLSGGELRILGSVRSFYHKQLAQETVRAVVAGLRLVNAVTVE